MTAAFRYFQSFPLSVRTTILALIFGAFAFVSTGDGQENTASEIRVPYGLTWGDPIDKIHEMISGVKAREISTSQKAPGKVVIEADGLGVGNPLLRKSVFTFRDGGLEEVELQYSDASWDGDKSVDFFDRTRRRIDDRYGSGTLLVNKVKETPSDATAPKDAAYTLIIYSWVQPIAALELNFYSMEEKDKAFRMVSLRYKAP
jgi:hypothetical protein